MLSRYTLSGLLVALLALCLPQASKAAECARSTLAAYTVVGFDCTIGDKEFSDFTYSQTVLNFAGIPAAGITVIPITTALNPGIEFFDPAGFSVSTAAAVTIYVGQFGYLVTVLPDGHDINDVTLYQLGGSITGVGALSVTKNYCATGGTLANCPPPTGGVLPGIRSLTVTNTLTTLTAAVAPPVDEMGVSDTLFLSAGNGAFAGSAHVSAFVNQFSEVAIPEASTWAMLGIGFAGLGFAGRRARKRTRALVL
jgi:hypothetical protein